MLDIKTRLLFICRLIWWWSRSERLSWCVIRYSLTAALQKQPFCTGGNKQQLFSQRKKSLRLPTHCYFWSLLHCPVSSPDRIGWAFLIAAFSQMRYNFLLEQTSLCNTASIRTPPETDLWGSLCVWCLCSVYCPASCIWMSVWGNAGKWCCSTFSCLCDLTPSRMNKLDCFSVFRKQNYSWLTAETEKCVFADKK